VKAESERCKAPSTTPTHYTLHISHFTHVLGEVGVGGGGCWGSGVLGAGAVVDNQSAKKGFITRMTLYAEGHEICMMLPLANIFGYCRDITTVTRGIKITIDLIRSRSSEYIFKAAGVNDGKIVMTAINLWIPKIKPSLENEVKINQILSSGSYNRTLYFEEMRIYRDQYEAADISPTWNVTTNQQFQKPTHIFVAFQNVNRYGSQDANNMVFDNCGVSSLYAMINSGQYPERALQTLMSTTEITLGHMMFQDALNKYLDYSDGTNISLEQFASLYPIFHIDVSKHEEVTYSGLQISLSWRLAGDPGFAYIVYVVILSDRFITVNSVNGRMAVSFNE